MLKIIFINKNIESNNIGIYAHPPVCMYACVYVCMRVCVCVKPSTGYNYLKVSDRHTNFSMHSLSKRTFT